MKSLLLAAALAASSQAGQPAPPDPATLQMPDMTPTRDRGVIANGWVHFYFHKEGVSYEQAYADFLDCYRFMPPPAMSGSALEAVPGDYVLYGLSRGVGDISTCPCLGTVGFSAEPGVITDLGYIQSDIVRGESSLPELRAESGFGPSSGDPSLLGATIRPARQDSTLPPALSALSIRPARYRAIGKFVEPRAHLINRLAPVPGILDYREGRVLDVASGEPAPDNY